MVAILIAYSGSVDAVGVSYNGTIENMPADGLLPENGIVTMIGGNETKDMYNLSVVMDTYRPGDTITVFGDDGDYYTLSGKYVLDQDVYYYDIERTNVDETTQFGKFIVTGDVTREE